MMKERIKEGRQYWKKPNKSQRDKTFCGQGERVNVINEAVMPRTQSNTEDVEAGQTGDRGRVEREEADDCNCIPDLTSFICPRESWIWSPCLREKSGLPPAYSDLHSSGLHPRSAAHTAAGAGNTSAQSHTYTLPYIYINKQKQTHAHFQHNESPIHALEGTCSLPNLYWYRHVCWQLCKR